jgi:Zn-dependent protease with chaperone function
VAGYAGRFADGRVAISRDVELRLGGGGLEIAEPGHAPIAVWPYESLRLLEPRRPGRPTRLACATDADARLTTDDALFLDALLPHAAALRTDARPGRRKVLAAILAVTALLAAAGTLYATVDLVAWIPAPVEDALGRWAVAQLIGGDAPCDGDAGREALARLTQRVAGEQAHGYTVDVFPDEDANAFAAPGNRIVLLDGLLQEAESPDEVAGVLAHEMAHARARHATRGLLRAMGLQTLVGMLLGGSPDIMQSGAQFGTVLVALSYSRRDEAEADAVGMTLLERANLRTDGLAQFFARLSEEHGDGILPAWLSTHPPTAERERRASDRAHDGPPALEAADWAALRSICGSDG